MKNSITATKITSLWSENETIIYYEFRCNDPNRPKYSRENIYFSLSEYDGVEKMRGELDSNGYNYDLVLVRYDLLNDKHLSWDYIVERDNVNGG